MKILELSNVKKKLRANSRVRNSSHKFKKYKSPLEAAGFFSFLNLDEVLCFTGRAILSRLYFRHRHRKAVPLQKIRG